MSKTNMKPVLAVDLGGTKIITAVVSPDGNIISRSYCLTLADKGHEAVISRLLSVIGKTMTQAKLRTSELAGMGIAAAGALDAERGVITDSPNLPGWRDIPLRDIMAEKVGVTTYVVNDASAAALGEHRFGAGKGTRNLIYITVSTGIGGGIVVDDKLYTGTDGTAGEIGHMTIEANGPECTCGNYGCLEVLASGTAVAKEAKKRLSQGETSSVLELANGKIEDIGAEIVARAAKQGDHLACEIVARAANYLGIGLANLVNIFNPEMIVIGGGMSKMGNMLLKPARKVVRERAFQLPVRTARIVRALLGGDAGVVGMAAYIAEQQWERDNDITVRMSEG